MNKQSKYNLSDLLVLLLTPLLATIISLFFSTGIITTLIFFYLPVCIYFSLRSKKTILKTLIFSFILTLAFIGIFDYLAYMDNAWFVRSMFMSRLYGVISYEELIWTFMFVYSIVIFYQHFIDRTQYQIFKSREKLGLSLLFTLFIIFFCLMLFQPSLLIIPYVYLWLGTTLMLIPTLIIFLINTQLIKGFFITACYFFIHSLLYEITALKLNQWSFPGSNYIWIIHFLDVSFPLEELVFFMILSSMTVLTYLRLFTFNNSSP